jgi:hypothetical protein
MAAFNDNQARMLIPGAFEPNLPPHRDRRTASPVPAAPFQEPRPRPETDSAPYVVAAPAQPTTVRGHVGAVLGDIALGTALVLGLVSVPILAVQAIGAAVTFIMETLGRQ